MAKEVVKAQSTALSVDKEAEIFGGLPTGLENVTAKDQLIPRLTILQGLSPQISPNNVKHIPNAKIGDICDTGTGDLFKEIIFLPCYYARIFLQWGPRKSGEGLKKNWGTDDSVLKRCKYDEKNRPYIPNGDLPPEKCDIVSETLQFFGLNLSAEERPSFFPLSATNVKHGKGLITKLMAQKIERPDGTKFQAPIFYRALRVSVASDKNNQGEWAVPRFELSEKVTDLDPSLRLLEKAKAFHEAARDNLVRGDVDPNEDTAEVVQAENHSM